MTITSASDRAGMQRAGNKLSDVGAAVETAALREDVPLARVVEEPHGWTLRTHNRSLAAHHDHTIVIRNGAAMVLTR